MPASQGINDASQLLPREIKLIDVITKTVQSDKPMPFNQCLIEAGYAVSTANDRTKDVIGKPRVQAALLQAMEKAGINDTKLSEVMKDGINANKIHGTSDDFIEVPDHPTRHKYLDTALKLRGEYPKEQAGIQVQGDLNVQIMDYSKTLEIHSEDKEDEE